MTIHRLLRTGSAALFLLLVCALPARSEIRAISDAERAAVEIAAAYLANGPGAIADRFTSTSPLGKLPTAERLAEIETLLGPHAGASWELQTIVPALKDKAAVFAVNYPSGLDETVTFELANENGAYRIAGIRILAHRSPTQPVFAAVTGTGDVRKEESLNTMPAAAGLVAAILCIAAAFVFRLHGAASRGLLAASVAIVVALVAFDVNRGRLVHPKKAEEKKTEQKEAFPRLASLLTMRRAMASGGGEIHNITRPACPNETCSEVAGLWMVQVDLQQMRTALAKTALKQLDPKARIPLAEILRGRLALFEADAVAAAIAYENAVNLGPGRDGLWYETAQALLALGFEDRAAGYLRRLGRVGSREADVYYTLSMLSAVRNKEEDAENFLIDAWKLQPAPRAEIVKAAPLWSVIRKPKTNVHISLSAPDEAMFSSDRASSRAIALPAGAAARISGDFFSVKFGEQELHVPGGAALAPIGTEVADAATWARTEEEQGIRDFDTLVAASRNAGAFTQPALRRRVTRTTNALVARNRWNDVVTLTEGLSPKSEHVPTELFFARNLALQRLDRSMEARRLMEEVAASPVLLRRKDADALEELAELLALHDLFDQAVKMYDRAQAIRPNPMIDERVRQLQMNKRLATKYSTHVTEHFEVRYPEDLSQAAAVNIGNILEAEFRRLQKWIPITDFKQVAVNIVWWQEFRNTYTGSDFILGFYQARKITLPFAGVRQFIPPVVGILTHELAHAMLAQATNEQAPRWFQEGMAQRVEMREYWPNAFNMYTDDKLLAISLLDSVMTGSPDPDMISEAYIESQTIIRYIEAKHGAAGIAKLIQAYREGATTDEAIARVTGQNVAQFDTALRGWGRSGQRVFEDAPPIRYDVDETESLRWSARGMK